METDAATGGGWDVPGVEVCWAVQPIGSSAPRADGGDLLVTPASVMKIQVAVTVANALENGDLDGAAVVALDPARRTPGPVGMSLMQDPVRMSVRDLLVPMMTISDNVATDALLALVGVDAVNATTARLGLASTHVAGDLRTMLDAAAVETGFADYAALVAHDPDADGPPSADEVRAGLADSVALDPGRGTRTTALDTVRLLDLIWTDQAGPPAACARVRWLMERQLTRHRIASGFGTRTSVAAKSGGLFGVVRNEAGVITTPDGASYALAIFTRREPDATVDAGRIDAAIGRLAARLVASLD